MTEEKQKVIKSFEECLKTPRCQDCPWESCERADCARAEMPYDLVYAALEMLKAQESSWISVKERLPDEHDSIFAGRAQLSKYLWSKESDNVNVYVEFPDGTGRVTEGRLQDGKWWTRISPVLNPVVTHWKPLPEPPKEEQRKAEAWKE